MSAYTQILYQVIFGSKWRETFFNEQNQEQLFAYMAGVSRKKKCYTYEVGGDKNHIHLLIDLHPTQCLSNYVKEVKQATSNWLEINKSTFTPFPGWQVGYGAFTYSLSAKANLKAYIRNQNEHHKSTSFRKEYITLLKKHGIKYDEKYLWT